MPQHFLQSARARTTSLRAVLAMTDQQAEEMFAEIRWSKTNGEPVCPHCGCFSPYTARRKDGSLRYRCKCCRKDFTLTSTTLFAHHKLPLRTYLAVIVSFLSEVKGKSALALFRLLDIHSETTFVLLHKMREALQTGIPEGRIGGKDKTVSIDGAFFGGKIRKKNRKTNRIDRRLALNKNGKGQCVTVAREHGGRTNTAVFPDERSAMGFITKNVHPGSTVMADGSTSWNVLDQHFDMHRINHNEAYSLDGACTNPAETFFSRLRRAEKGHHHHIAGPYLDRYAAEMAWREDNRRLPTGAQVEALIGLALAAKPSKKFCGYWQRARK